MKKLILAAVAIVSFAASADLKPMATDGVEGDVANIATSIYKVQNFQVGGVYAKVTQLVSVLNGHNSTTVILALGESGVGGEAGYDAAFLILPDANANLTFVKSVQLVKDTFVFSMNDLNGKTVIKKYRYDQKAKVLKTVP